MSHFNINYIIQGTQCGTAAVTYTRSTEISGRKPESYNMDISVSTHSLHTKTNWNTNEPKQSCSQS